MSQPEQQAREKTNHLLARAGWHECNASQADIHASRGVAIRKFPLKSGHGSADKLLYVDGRAAGFIEPRKRTPPSPGWKKYTKGLPDGLSRWSNPLPFSYQSTGVETRFTNGPDPEPRSHPVSAFHKPETLATWRSR